MDNKQLAKIIGKAIFYSSILSSIGSVEMSSKFSVMNFSKDQETLQRAADALKSFIIVGCVWTVGSVLSLYASYGWCGAWIGLVASLIMMAWIVLSYLHAFNEAAKQYGLIYPTIFSKSDWIIFIVFVIISLGPMIYYSAKIF
jgi:hypothetical protein